MENSVYQKLSAGIGVNLLVIGDSISEGAGASDERHMWSSLLKSRLEEKYGSEVHLTNVSMGGNASYAGYARTMALDDGVDYDLAVLCYGQNDSPVNFGLYYESIIRAVKLKYPKASVISVLESSQREFTEKMRVICSIAEHYGIPTADTITPYQPNYNDLTGDGVHPNDAGQVIYCNAVMKVIEDFVSSDHGFDPTDVEPVDGRVTVFDTFRYIGADKFIREGNTFTVKTSVSGTVLGIDYDFRSGENDCRIEIDGSEYVSPHITFNYNFSQHHIMVVNNWLDGDKVNVRDGIKVIFADNESGKSQADGFRGLMISGL